MVDSKKFVFKKIKSVTLPVLKLTEAQPRYVKIMQAMYEGRKMDDKKEPATLAECVDLETGENGLIIFATVLRTELNAAYPDGSYVGKCFEFVNEGKKKADQKYNNYRVTQIEEPSAPETETVVASDGKSAQVKKK